MSDDFSNWLGKGQQRVNEALTQSLGGLQSEYGDNANEYLQQLEEASYYSLLSGGKRVRSLLCYGAAEAAGQLAIEPLDQVVSAIELIHAYSLVHDDLPAMDNDDMRRGKPTNHIAYDEATAILVGDALQARAFELLSDCTTLSAEIRIKLVKELSAASGVRGMVGGQAIDISATDKNIDLQNLEIMHQLKTGALIRASVAMGAIVAGATGPQRQALDQFALHIGLAFQIQDDILDEEGDSDELGKTRGADRHRNKPTYTSLLGSDKAKDEAQRSLNRAKIALLPFKEAGTRLAQLADYIVSRNC
jgi:geranylgeranyl diphosphate synthase type II